MIRMIAAIDGRRGLARGGRIPWQPQLPSDTKYYIGLTKNQAVAVGKTTYLKMGGMNLAERYSHVYVLSSEPMEVPNGEVVNNAKDAIRKSGGNIWVLGGGQVYEQFMPFSDEIYLTRVSGDYDCDVFFPEFEEKFDLYENGPVQSENGIDFNFQIWKPKQV